MTFCRFVKHFSDYRVNSAGAVLRLIFLVLLAVVPVVAAEERVFTEDRFGAGELKYINDVPVLSVAGSPTEMGRQIAALTGPQIKQLIDYPKRLLTRRAGAEEGVAKYLSMCRTLFRQLPEEYREEMRATADQLGLEPDLGLLANFLPDIYRRGFSCSSLIVEPEHSATAAPIFGRNLDFYTLGMLDKYTLVTVYHPKGKRAFVSIGFPGLFGCLSGMNEAGLTAAVHEVFLSRDGAEIFNPRGIPYTFAIRRVLEQCSSVEEVEREFQAMERTTIINLALCDARKSKVLEMTPKTVASRGAIDGICACTNHFRTDELAVFAWCPRYRRLIQARSKERLTVADVAQKMHEVNLVSLTVQTMIFEPAALRLHLAFGSCPSSALPLKVVELKPLLTP